MFVGEGADKLTVPVAGDAVSQGPPERVLVLAVQLRALAQAPLEVMLMGCGCGADWPPTPVKLSASGIEPMEQGGCTTNVIGIDCGLPAAGLLEPFVELMVIKPL
jgi:hypothetical protein